MAAHLCFGDPLCSVHRHGGCKVSDRDYGFLAYYNDSVPLYV